MSLSIPYVPLSPDEKRECVRIMRAGNTLMKAWAEDYFDQQNMAHQLRRGLFKWLANPQDPEAIDPATVGIPKSVLEIILRVRQVESEIMFGYVRMVSKIASLYGWATRISYLDFDDLLLEGFIALRDSIYSFSNEEADFISYAYGSIKRRVRRQINEAIGLGGFTDKGYKMIERFNAARRKMEKEMGGAVQLSTVLWSLKLDEDDERHLRSLLKRCIRASAMTYSEDEGTAYENLGTVAENRDVDLMLLVEVMDRDGIAPDEQGIILAAAQGKLAYDDAEILAVPKKGRRSYKERKRLIRLAAERGREFWDAVQRLDMSDLERELVIAAANGEKNFQSRIVAAHINPKTGEPYSRMWATFALRRVTKRLEAELSDQYAAA